MTPRRGAGKQPSTERDPGWLAAFLAARNPLCCRDTYFFLLLTVTPCFLYWNVRQASVLYPCTAGLDGKSVQTNGMSDLGMLLSLRLDIR
jgi:hypothetical protein